jgi:hypothetical protein
MELIVGITFTVVTVLELDELPPQEAANNAALTAMHASK